MIPGRPDPDLLPAGHALSIVQRARRGDENAMALIAGTYQSARVPGPAGERARKNHRQFLDLIARYPVPASAPSFGGFDDRENFIRGSDVLARDRAFAEHALGGARLAVEQAAAGMALPPPPPGMPTLVGPAFAPAPPPPAYPAAYPAAYPTPHPYGPALYGRREREHEPWWRRAWGWVRRPRAPGVPGAPGLPARRGLPWFHNWHLPRFRGDVDECGYPIDVEGAPVTIEELTSVAERHFQGSPSYTYGYGQDDPGDLPPDAATHLGVLKGAACGSPDPHEDARLLQLAAHAALCALTSCPPVAPVCVVLLAHGAPLSAVRLGNLLANAAPEARRLLASAMADGQDPAAPAEAVTRVGRAFGQAQRLQRLAAGELGLPDVAPGMAGELACDLGLFGWGGGGHLPWGGRSAEVLRSRPTPPGDPAAWAAGTVASDLLRPLPGSACDVMHPDLPVSPRGYALGPPFEPPVNPWNHHEIVNASHPLRGPGSWR